MFRSISTRVSTSLKLQVNTLARRTYAEAAATSGALKLQFALPHETLYTDVPVTQVNLPAKSGRIGVLANHVPLAEQLTPGVIEIFEGTTTPKSYFISGGFATVQPDSQLCITAVEAFPLDSFSKTTIQNLLVEAKKNTTDTDEKKAAEAAIQVEVLQDLQSALK